MALNVPFVANVGVSRANLRVAELLGATNLPLPRPQLFLSDTERAWAQSMWNSVVGGALRVVIAPGIGSEGRGWPVDRFAELAARLVARGDVCILIIGGKQDIPHGNTIEQSCPTADNQCGNFSLRQSFAAVSEADLVVCNNSMLSHASAAFAKPTVVLLGQQYVFTQRERGAWGYDGISEFLGREGKETQIATVDQAFEVVNAKLNALA
jgi:heptosyltransferase-2